MGDSESLHGVISSLRAQLAESENATKAAREHTKIVGDSKVIYLNLSYYILFHLIQFDVLNRGHRR